MDELEAAHVVAYVEPLNRQTCPATLTNSLARELNSAQNPRLSTVDSMGPVKTMQES